jgi:formylglycine-generating enzyme required for sulfatase activity
MSGKYALIIANTEYTDPGLAQLTAPGKDAKEFGRVLDSPDICAFDDVVILLNEAASKVNESIDYFLSNRKQDDLLVLYFSGHGVRDEYGSLYLAVTNTNRSRLRSTAVKSDFIREAMDQSRSKRQVLILDCCNSGAFAQGTKAETGGSVGTAAAFEGTGYGRVVLTASDSTQFAWEGDQVIGETENSLFTYYLVKGLEGEADTNGDGRITIDELYDYTYEKIVNITPKQTPGKWSYKQQGEIVLRHNIRIEDTRPVPLPDDLVSAMNNSLPYIREGAVSQLELLLKGKNLSLARSARMALERISAEDDSRRVVQAATKALGSVLPAGQVEAQKSEGYQPPPPTRTAELRREKIEQETRFKAEQTRLMQEKAELEKRLQEEHLARDKAEQERVGKITAVQSAKPRVSPIAIWGVAIFAVLLGAFAFARFIPLLNPPLTEVPLSTQAPILVPTEAPVDTPSPTEEESAPTEAATVPPTEEAIPTSSTAQSEIADEKGVAMVLVPAGNFVMGSTKGDLDERPIHSVYLNAYYIDKFEVTNALYQACVNTGTCKPPVHADSYTRSSYYGNPFYNDYPVVWVDWNMAKAYCEWRGARLPTEAEWEKAARGAEELTYPWGKGVDCQKANFTRGHNACVVGTSKVGTYEGGKSPYGVYDMAGNVWEWVADWYSATYYASSLTSNPPGPDAGRARVLRGGSWNRGEMDIRSSNRVNYAPNYNNFDAGFRCASSLP